MGKIEITLEQQPWYRRQNLYPGQVWYRAAGASNVWTVNDRVMVIMNTDFFPGRAFAPKVRVTVEWDEPTQGTPLPPS
jgi:hypothetical protein